MDFHSYDGPRTSHKHMLTRWLQSECTHVCDRKCLLEQWIYWKWIKRFRVTFTTRTRASTHLPLLLLVTRTATCSPHPRTDEKYKKRSKINNNYYYFTPNWNLTAAAPGLLLLLLFFIINSKTESDRILLRYELL